MNISHAKTKIALIAALAAAAALAGGVTSLKASAAEAPQKDASLFLPSSYEQYLELDAPTVAAFSAGHIAIADGDTLYLFDRNAESYSETDLPEGERVTQLGFAGERLFVSTRSASNYFYEYNFETEQLDSFAGINFSTFCIDGNTLYTANVGGTSTTIASYSIDDLTQEKPAHTDLGTVENNATPNMTFLGGKLYCAFNYVVFYQNEQGQFDAKSCFFLSNNAADVASVKSVCALGDFFYFTASDGLYRTDKEGNSALIAKGENFSALTSFGGKLYMIAGSSIKELTPTADGADFTGYEIASASSSVNRLSGAVDTARAGDLLVTADAAGSRVNVYNFATEKYSEITGIEGFTPTHVATDGSIIALSTENDIYACTYSEKDEMIFSAVKEGTETAIRGLACVYGEVYYVTGTYCGKVGGEEVPHQAHDSPYALASDVYGDLFVVCGSAHEVIRYTEREFCDPEAEGETLPFRLPDGFRSLRADFEGNLYYLIGDTLYRNENEVITTVHGSDYVYTMSEDAPSAFALGYEDDAVYFLFGDRIVGTREGALDIPTLREIPSGEVADKIFSVHGTEDLFVKIPAGTIGVRTDLDALREDAPAFFPYEFYFRTESEARGILLAEQGGYALVVLYEPDTGEKPFTAGLFRIDPEQEGLIAEESEYWTEEASVKYLTSDVSLYYYPCLPSALADVRLSRGARVEVIGLIHAPEQHDYALVEYSGTGKSAVRGYVPVDYLTSVDPNPAEDEAFLFATLKKADAGYVFSSEDGQIVTLHGGERVRLTDNGDGTYTARYTAEDGKVYSAVIPQRNLDFGQNDALRIALIVILSVVAVLIVALYVWFLPRKKKER